MKNNQKGNKVELDDFFKDAQEAPEFKKVTKQIIDKESEKLIDAIKIKQGEDWGVLANQVVGSEVI